MSSETRRKVLNAVRHLGYRRQGKVSGDIAFVATTVQGISMTWLLQAAAEYGFSVRTMLADDKRETPPVVEAEGRMAGVVIYGGLWRRVFLERLAERHPTVLLGSYLPHIYSDAVWVDNAGGVYTAVDNLVHMGHSAVALINGPGNSSTSAEKQIGFERALRHAGLQGVGRIVEAKDFTYEDGKEAASRLLRADPRPTAVVAGETIFGAAVLDVCHELGLGVPTDLSLIAFRDRQYLNTLNPSVSAIRIPELAIYRKAISSLVLRIHDPVARGQRILLQPELVHRGSVASHYHPQGHTTQAQRLS